MVETHTDNEKVENKTETLTPKGFTKLTETLFLAGVAGSSIIFGFGTALAMAKKKDPEYFMKGLAPEVRMESGGSLALRAFGRGSLYAITGCGVLFYAMWKLIGVQDLQEFRQKVGGVLPRIPKNDPPQGRTEFESLTDLFQYIVDVDNQEKLLKLEAAKSSSTDSIKSDKD